MSERWRYACPEGHRSVRRQVRVEGYYCQTCGRGMRAARGISNMSKSDIITVEAETMHGTVEYEVVECASCGQRERKGDAWRFSMGKGHEKRYGWACTLCAEEEEPAGYPMAKSSGVSGSKWFVILAALAPAVSIVYVVSINKWETDIPVTVVGACIGTALWLGLLIVIGVV